VLIIGLSVGLTFTRFAKSLLSPWLRQFPSQKELSRNDHGALAFLDEPFQKVEIKILFFLKIAIDLSPSTRERLRWAGATDSLLKLIASCSAALIGI
jgi:hypothetical protein